MRRILVEFRYRAMNREAGADRSLSVIIVSLRPAKIGHHAIAEILSNMPLEANDRLSCSPMIAGERIAPFLRVKLCGKSGRGDEIAKENRQMPPLGG